LAAAAEDFARAQGAGVMKLWSDTRFDRAHRFYEKLGYLRDGPIRVLNDLSNSLEFAYTKPLTGVAVRVLDAAAAASAAPGLAAVLQACVADGFLPPLDRATARAQFQKVAKDVARGQRVLLAAWVDGVLAGTVQMALDMPANQRHRAEIAKLLVLPAMRRRGVARRLMDAAEAAALAAGRSLLVLETPAGDAAEALYRKLGWIEAGRIPGFALDADGTAQAAVIFYRTVG
jgi:GNAT superfamily N-acetyltransferase